jgi:hypothetical protein
MDLIRAHAALVRHHASCFVGGGTKYRQTMPMTWKARGYAGRFGLRPAQALIPKCQGLLQTRNSLFGRSKSYLNAGPHVLRWGKGGGDMLSHAQRSHPSVCDRATAVQARLGPGA